MIYVTHNQMEAMRMSNRIAILNDGRLMQCDTPMNIFSQPINKFVANFIGAPAMNMFPAKIVTDDGESMVDIDGIRLRLEKDKSRALLAFNGREVTAGVRPQQIFHFKDREGRRRSDTEVEVEILLVEPLGERLMVTAKMGKREMVFFMISDRVPAPGERFSTVIDGRNIHLFERESGERITLGE
jgi:ABC-type sugar transport system ATPase subunit